MVISLGGQTYAQKAARYLRQNRINSELIKLDTQKNRGCVWGLRLAPEDAMAATSLLKKAGIAYEYTKTR